MNFLKLLDPATVIAQEAGELILKIYSTKFNVEEKDDMSPLTLADTTSHQYITHCLQELTPEIPIISEESGMPDYDERKKWDVYWLIDPLDGTKEFVKKNGEFTVNIALIINNKPVLGVVDVPAKKHTYVGCKNFGAEVRVKDQKISQIHVAKHSQNPIRVAGSRSHAGTSLNVFLKKLNNYKIISMGSSLKFCLIAEGSADIYPRLSPTSEWDTAAAQAIVEQSGGKVITLDGKSLQYNKKEDILNPHFLVIGPEDYDWINLAKNN